MKIFSSHRKKLEPSRRFGGNEFQKKIQKAQNYKRAFDSNPKALSHKILSQILKAKKFWRNVAILFLILAAYYLFLSNRFVVSNIKISGNIQISNQQIADAFAQAGQSRFFLIKKTSFFLLTRGRANKILTTALPNIKEISEYHRVWPNSIEISVKERTPGFAIKSNNKYFLIDDEGVVVSEINPSKDMLVIEDQAVEDFALGEQLPNSKLAPFVITMGKQWPGKMSVGITSVKFTGKNSNDVQFETAEGWSVMFDITRSVTTQLNNLSVILSKQVGKDRSKLAYIDLRLAKWAYYCFKASPCQQQEQPEETTNVTK